MFQKAFKGKLCLYVLTLEYRNINNCKNKPPVETGGVVHKRAHEKNILNYKQTRIYNLQISI